VEAAFWKYTPPTVTLPLSAMASVPPPSSPTPKSPVAVEPSRAADGEQPGVAGAMPEPHLSAEEAPVAADVERAGAGAAHMQPANVLPKAVAVDADDAAHVAAGAHAAALGDFERAAAGKRKGSRLPPAAAADRDHAAAADVEIFGEAEHDVVAERDDAGAAVGAGREAVRQRAHGAAAGDGQRAGAAAADLDN
jgi:hypothetical protein